MTQTQGSFDHAAVARAHAVVARAAAGAREARAVLDLVVAHLSSLLDARQCLVMVLRGDQRVRMVASHGLKNPIREVLFRSDRDSLAMTAMAERRPLSSADILAEPAVELSSTTRAFIEAEGYRAALAVPLLVETRVLGVLLVTRTDVGAWTSAEMDLAQAFADHVTAALERERLSSLDVARAEFDEALADVERQLLAELSVERLLPLIVDHARRAIGAEGSIYVADPDRQWLQEACTSWPEPQGGRPFGIGVAGVCAETRRGLVVNDYPKWSKANPASLARGARHVMAEPFLSRTRLLGVIAMARRDAAARFDERDQAVLRRFAVHAALALNNAIVYSEANQRRRGAEALARMARALSEAPELATAGAQVVGSVRELFGLECTLRLIQPDGSLAAIASTLVAAGHVQARGTGLTARVLAEGRAASTNDLGAEPGVVLDEDLRGRVGNRGVLIVPLRAEGGITGVLQIVAPGAREFSTLEVELAQAFADQAAAALARAQLHADLRTSERRTRLIIDTALDAVVTIDTDGRITGWNAQAERTFGWTREDVMGRILSETIIPVRYRDAHEAGLRRFRVTGEGPVINRRLELSALHRDGREFPVELSISPVAAGGATTFSAFVRDITQRMQAEAEIRRQTGLVQLLQKVAVAANAAPTALDALQIAVDQVCAFTGWPVGDAFVLAGDGSGDLVSARIWHVDHPERYRGFREISEGFRFARGTGLPGRVLAAGQAAWIMDVTKDPNFPRRDLAADIGVACAFGFPVLAGSEVVAVLEFFTDEPREPDAALLDVMANIGTQLGRVFERESSQAVLREAKDAAETASRAKSAFLANMSHELRTPMNAILGYAQVLARDAELASEQQRAVGVIERSGEHLLSLINEVLDLAKIEAGTIEVRPAPFDVAALLGGLADMVRARAADRGLAFTFDVPPVLPAAVVGDDTRARQVLTNLLDNAIKYTPRGTVTLMVTRDGTRYRFAVEDTGVGIAAEDLPRIFETFHQVRSPQAFADGAGLGLAISKTLVALMGGVLEVTSAPGQGSRFWFDLDLPEVTPGDVLGRTARRIVGLRDARQRLLVVDDKADNRRLLRDLLVPVGFEVEEAADGASCLERVLADSPAAVLLDLRMPGLSGLETTRRLRELQPGRRLVVIAVSASVFGHDRDECIAAGADDFLAKPFRLERLLEMLSHHLALEPVYAEAAPGDAADLVFPAPDVVAELLEHARRGDIRQVLERAGRIEAADARHRAFVRDVRALAEQFQVNRLCLFLEEGRPIS